jgi:hypothetical protein
MISLPRVRDVVGARADALPEVVLHVHGEQAGQVRAGLVELHAVANGSDAKPAVAAGNGAVQPAAISGHRIDRVELAVCRKFSARFDAGHAIGHRSARAVRALLEVHEVRPVAVARVARERIFIVGTAATDSEKRAGQESSHGAMVRMNSAAVEGQRSFREASHGI